jgi:hypothetical protein
LLATFVGYELNLLWMTATQWFLILALGQVSDKIRNIESSRASPSGQYHPAMFWLRNVPTLFCGFLVVLVIASGLATQPSRARDGSISLFVRDGVIDPEFSKNDWRRLMGSIY